LLHLWKFLVISYVRTNSAEMPGNRTHREPRGIYAKIKGDGVAESESPGGGSHRNWQQLAHRANKTTRQSLFPAGKVLFASPSGP